MWLEHADSYLEPLLNGAGTGVTGLGDEKIYVACMLYVAFWALGFARLQHTYSARWMEILSMDLMMLHALQHWPSEAGKMLALTLVGLHFTGMSVLMYIQAKSGPKKFTAQNVYQDLNGSWSVAITVFCGQLFLVYLYTNSILQNEIDFDHVSYAYWIGSIVAIQMASMFGRGADSQLGYAFHAGLWSHLLRRVDGIAQQKDDKEELIQLNISKAALVVRALMSFIINNVMRCLVGVSMPIILMQSNEPMDFLQNCLAVAFIFQLDDTSIGGSYVLTLSQPYETIRP